MAFQCAFYRDYSVLIFLLLFNYCKQFNVDLPSVSEYRSENKSMFGFTVAQYKYDDKNWILVGAPKAKDLYFSGLDPSYVGGSVYRCNVTEPKQCEQIKFSTAARTEVGNLFENENISEQWLGATLLTSVSNRSSILACAPRYYKTLINGSAPFGTCFYSDNGFSNFVEYSLCRIRSDKHNDINFYRSCQAGFSAALSKDSNRLYFGAVGAYAWRGKLFSIDKSVRIKSHMYNDQNIREDPFGPEKIRWNSPSFRVTEKPKEQDASIFRGFSMTSLNLSGRSNLTSGVAAGTPRNKNCLGVVDVLTENFVNITTLTGEQMGAYFGYSIATADVDGDGTDDLIIGAPMYSNHNKSLVKNHETGRIYVYYQGNATCSKLDIECGEKKFNKRDIIDGEHPAGRFGLAIASLGDIDLDGCDDFAVGAPYEGMGSCTEFFSNTGAVYIFHGSNEGVTKYSQVIRASDVYYVNKALSSLNTFGFSITGGQDLDGNLYPDLVVGAYESDAVYFFKSRPVIKLVADLSFTSENKTITINKRDCKLQNNETVPCVSLQLCLNYNGINVQDEFEISWNITLDVKRLDAPRMFFIDGDKKNIMRNHSLLNKGIQKCLEWKTYIVLRKGSTDKLSEIVAQIQYEPANSTRNDQLPSTLGSKTSWFDSDSISIRKQCANDNICIPELTLNITTDVTKFLLGSRFLHLNVEIVNKGDDSFGTIFELKLPSKVSYSQFKLVKRVNDDEISCNSTIICDLGEIPKGGMVIFNITLDQYPETDASKLEFWSKVKSINAENTKTGKDNEMNFSIPIIEDSNLLIKGSSYPENLTYDLPPNDFTAEASVRGPQMKHKYILVNSGPSTASELVVELYWPVKLSTGEDLLFLIDQLTTNKPEETECDLINVTFTNSNLSTDSQHQHVNPTTQTDITTTVSQNENKVTEPDAMNNSSMKPESTDDVVEMNYGFGYCNETRITNMTSFFCNADKTRFSFSFENTNYCGVISNERNTRGVWDNGACRIEKLTKHNTSKISMQSIDKFNITASEKATILKPIKTTSEGTTSKRTTSKGTTSKGKTSKVKPSKGTTTKSTKKTTTKTRGRRSLSDQPDKTSKDISSENQEDRNINNDNDTSKFAEENNHIKDTNKENKSQLNHQQAKRVTDGIVNNSFCSYNECIKIRCKITRLHRNDEVSFSLPSIVRAKTIQKISAFKTMQIASYMEVDLTKFPAKRTRTSKTTYYSSEVITNIIPPNFVKTPPIVDPLWIIVASACSGTLLLMLITYALYKCGFFTRNHPPTIPTQEWLYGSRPNEDEDL